MKKKNHYLQGIMAASVRAGLPPGLREPYEWEIFYQDNNGRDTQQIGFESSKNCSEVISELGWGTGSVMVAPNIQIRTHWSFYSWAYRPFITMIFYFLILEIRQSGRISHCNFFPCSRPSFFSGLGVMSQ
jgi:hypothetical protein